MLSDLGVGETAMLVALDLPPGVQNHLLYMGFVPDTKVKALHRAPAGDPTVYAVNGIEIALRRETARFIRVVPVTAESIGQALTKVEIGRVTEAGDLLEAVR